MSLEEKGGVPGAEHDELKTFNVQGGDEALQTVDPEEASISEEEYAAVLKKIDWRLTPVLALINAIQIVDKNVSRW
jgi:MFS transporter, ACS family, allantoate permease